MWGWLKEKIRRFKVWREQPRQVAPMTQEEHECLNCHEHYIGRFCPRCGQAATASRFSMKVAAENFANAYGMGERGMFRTMRDLLLRPGYMILDYLRGMRVSYFGPFKMFFLLFTLSTFVTHGLNIKGQPLYEDSQSVPVSQKLEETTTVDDDTITVTGLDGSESTLKMGKISDRIKSVLRNIFSKMEYFEKRFPSINMLLALMVESGFLYLFFRHCPNIPDLRYSEFFVSLVYIANMYTIYSIVFDFFCLSTLSKLSFLLALIPLKQLSGYSWRRTTLKSVAAFVIIFVLLLLLTVSVMYLFYFLMKKGL